MTIGNLVVVDPYDEEIVQKVTEFEEQNNIKPTTAEKAEKIRRRYTEKEYETLKKEGNEINEILFLLKDGKIIDTAYIEEGVKDISRCTITFPKTGQQKRKIIDLATDYAFNVLSLKEVFVSAKGDLNLQSQLIKSGFECLGEANGAVKYLREKSEEKIKTERAI